MKKAIWIGGAFGILAVLVSAGVAAFVLYATSAEAAPNPAAQTSDALGRIRTTGTTIVCGAFHEPLIVAGVPLRFEENFLIFEDDYRLAVVEPFSFYAGKYLGLQFDPDTREVVRSILVGDDNYYPCPTG